MYVLFVEFESETRAKVIYSTARPDLLPPQISEQGIELDDIPEPVYLPKKYPQQYINPVTLEQWYEQVDRPATQEEKMEDLSAEMRILKVLVQFIVPKWKRNGESYEKKDIVRLNIGIFQCLQDHTSTAELKPNLTLETYWTKIADL